MGEAVSHAKRERELTKAALSEDLDRLESRVRRELDWKTRLRRDGPRYAVIGTVVVVAVAGGFLIRKVLGGSSRPKAPDRPELKVGSLEDVAKQLREIRKELDGRGGGTGSPLWQKLLLRSTSAAGTAAGTIAARQLMDRLAPKDGAVPGGEGVGTVPARDAAGR